jgi:uncharacterized membrane-anchored protein
MNALPPDHPERRVAADEVHARPQEALEAPLRASYIAITVEREQRAAELAHVAALCAHFNVPAPGPGDNQFSANLGPLRFKWERHTEFSGYTFMVSGAGTEPFADDILATLPDSWLATIPGQTVVAVKAVLLRTAVATPDVGSLSPLFGGTTPVGATVGDGAGSAFTDFRAHADHYVRLVIYDHSFTPRQAGRMLQRLFDIEGYRVMALLALPIARRLAPQIADIERALAALTDRIARDSSSDEALLNELTKLAADVEKARNASQVRFGASRAYHELVLMRIAELREQRLPGIQTIHEFMTRRLSPAMATCTSVAERLRDLAERVANTSGLLSTRVEIARERQNQSLLASMDRRARMQLRLQHTVEWLSVAAVTYYAAALVGYVSKALKAEGVHVDPDIVIGIAVPVIGVLVALALRRARRKAEGNPRAPKMPGDL